MRSLFPHADKSGSSISVQMPRQQCKVGHVEWLQGRSGVGISSLMTPILLL